VELSYPRRKWMLFRKIKLGHLCLYQLGRRWQDENGCFFKLKKKKNISKKHLFQVEFQVLAFPTFLLNSGYSSR
jgi:hypothetical protein